MRFTTGIIAVSIVILILLASFVVILRNQLDVKELELSSANKTISEQAAALEAITAQRKIDDRIVTEFTKSLTELRAATEAQSTAINELSRHDPEVKNFLDLLLPTPLGDLLNGRETPDNDDKVGPAR